MKYLISSIAGICVMLLAFAVSKAFQSPQEGTRHPFTMIMVSQSSGRALRTRRQDPFRDEN